MSIQETSVMRLIPHLVNRERTGRVKVSGFLCKRIGRNRVWNVNRGADRFYVTLCSNEAEFKRRVTGVEISGKLAAKHAHILPIQLEGLVTDHLAIVTRAVTGNRVDHLLKNAFRIDRNPLRLKSAIGKFQSAIGLVRDYLSSLHAEIVPDCCHLYDHGAEKTILRVRQNLDRLATRIPEMSEVNLRLIPSEAKIGHVERRLIIGDASPGNFIVNGNRIACVDFEDLGVGEPQRDFITLSESFRCGPRSWAYWRFDPAELLPVPEGNAILRMMYLLELNLLRIWKELTSGRRTVRVQHEVHEACRRVLSLQPLAI